MAKKKKATVKEAVNTNLTPAALKDKAAKPKPGKTAAKKDVAQITHSAAPTERKKLTNAERALMFRTMKALVKEVGSVRKAAAGLAAQDSRVTASQLVSMYYIEARKKGAAPTAGKKRGRGRPPGSTNKTSGAVPSPDYDVQAMSKLEDVVERDPESAFDALQRIGEQLKPFAWNKRRAVLRGLLAVFEE